MNDFSRNHLNFTGPKVFEPTLADAIAAIGADMTLPELKRRHWLTSLRGIAEAIGRASESLPCRLTSLRHHVGRINAAAVGWTPKTLANHKSNARAAINYFMKVQGVPRRGARLTPAWHSLMSSISEKKPRCLLSGLSRYCSERKIAPGSVTEKLIATYWEFRETTGFLRQGVALPRETMKAWNSCVECVAGWPGRALTLPEVTPRTMGPAWEQFPEQLRSDLETYLAGLTSRHGGASGRRSRGCKASTCITRRREVVAFARTAVASGVPIQSLTSLAELLAPDVANRTFETYLERNGERPKVYTIDLAWKLQSIAKSIGAPAETIDRLDEIRVRLDEQRGPVLTEKNYAVIRTILMTDTWSRVLDLPERLIAEAYRMLNRSPQKAASLAALALQIQLLTRAPVRVGNLLSIRLGANLHRTGGPGSNYRLHFPGYDVKNRVELDSPLGTDTSRIINGFINDFRHLLSDDHHGDWLFPGEDGKHRSCSHASASIASRIEREVGLRVTAHQFRHAAAATILKVRPGNYEFVRQILGHLNIETTVRFYTALESFQASLEFGAIMEEQVIKIRDRRLRKRKSPTLKRSNSPKGDT
jgi:integrase